mgnify:CR=1 FL=1
MIARPSPVPSVVELFSISSRSNFVNNLEISSFLIPLPVSLTLIIKIVSSSLLIHLEVNSTVPSLVYLIALIISY